MLFFIEVPALYSSLFYHVKLNAICLCNPGVSKVSFYPFSHVDVIVSFYEVKQLWNRSVIRTIAEISSSQLIKIYRLSISGRIQEIVQ
jgi:hypothetical protein